MAKHAVRQRRLSDMTGPAKAPSKGVQGTLDRAFGLVKKPKVEVEAEASAGATGRGSSEGSGKLPAETSPEAKPAIGATLEPSAEAPPSAAASPPLPPASPTISVEPSAAAARVAAGGATSCEEDAQGMEVEGKEEAGEETEREEEAGEEDGDAKEEEAREEGAREGATTEEEEAEGDDGGEATPAASEGPAASDSEAVSEEDSEEESDPDSESEDATFAPSDLLREESRLRSARERDRDAGAARADPLESARFQQLEALLTQSKLYTEFLVEQMAEAEAELDQAAVEAAAKAKAKAKAKAAEAKKGAAKRGKGARRGKKAESAAEGGAKEAGAGASGEASAPAPASGQTDLVAATASLCPGLATPLRDYQLRGVRWMISLYQNGINGILADQMGLGKTLQTIGLICHLRSKGVMAPYLVLGPLSTLSNWVDEFARHAPGVPTVLYHGSKERRAALAKTLFARPPTAASPVVVTSYEIAIADAKKIAKWQYKYLVVDEGHRLKNPSCKLLRELKAIQADNRLLLTGTPLQNNLTELWSLLNFILPQVFASLSDFGAWFDQVGDDGDEDDEAGGEAEAVAAEAAAEGDAQPAKAAPLQRRAVAARLHAVLKPFLLRRVKDDVEASLPGKMEILLYAPMTPAQRELDALLRARGGVAKAEAKAAEKRKSQESEADGGAIADAPPRQRKRRRNELEALRASNAVWAGVGGGAERPAADGQEPADGSAPEAADASSKTRRGRAAAGLTLGAPASAPSSSSAPSLTQLRNTLMQLRKVCNHPDLVSGATDGSLTLPGADESIAQCGKMKLLDRLLSRLINGGHRVLIFSQMTAVLDLISAYLDERGFAHVRLDGAMPWDERKEAIQRFNDARVGRGADAEAPCKPPAAAPASAFSASPLPDPSRLPHVFLLSTRAGGLGINLTSADTAIIYDSDWNPHQDLQAMDRCHRIGQVKPVLVLRLATARSVEGKMLRRARQKLDLERVVIKRGAFLHDLGKGKKKGAAPSAASREELLDMLRDDEGGVVGNRDAKGESDGAEEPRDGTPGAAAASAVAAAPAAADASLSSSCALPGGSLLRHDSAAAVDPQAGVVDDATLDALLDRSHLEGRGPRRFGEVGVGYEVVAQAAGSGMLSGVE